MMIRSGDLSSIAVWPVGLILGGAVGNFADRMPGWTGDGLSGLWIGYGALADFQSGR